MLHAGYLGSLGVDVTTAQWDPDPIYPESGIRPKIWRTWLPDIFLNPHGYPSHEWVQIFSEYAAWVRTRSVETRDYWTMRGWWMPGFGWLDDARYPRHKAILDYLVQGRHEVERKVDLFWNGVSLSMNRPRPPKPPKTDEEKNTTSEEGRLAHRSAKREGG